MVGVLPKKPERLRVLICGGRRYGKLPRRREDPEWDARMAERVAFWCAMHAVEDRVCLVIHGGADGADALAPEWARAIAVPQMVFRADWDRHGKAAGPIRNQAMIEVGKPDVVIAFPGRSGTADTVRRARAAGIPVFVPSVQPGASQEAREPVA